MLSNKIKSFSLLAALSLIVFGVGLFPVSAQTVTPGAKKADNEQQRIANLISRGDAAIAMRISSLNEAITKIQALVKLTADQKSALINNDNNVLATLNSLKTKIDADTVLTTLRTDVMGIYNNVRVYLLVLPQTNILAASDRIQDVVVNLNALAAKLQTRITQAQSAGHVVTSLQASLTDLNAKDADAQTQAQNAMNGVSELTPDQGDKTKLASNNQAIQTAKGEIKTGEQDIKTAYSDAKSIIASLKTFK